jgi:hypothetical protein
VPRARSYAGLLSQSLKPGARASCVGPRAVRRPARRFFRAGELRRPARRFFRAGEPPALSVQMKYAHTANLQTTRNGLAPTPVSVDTCGCIGTPVDPNLQKQATTGRGYTKPALTRASLISARCGRTDLFKSIRLIGRSGLER